MGTLWLVRHGQTAGFLTGEYRTLTELGVTQGRALGRFMAEQGIRPDVVVRGPLERHAGTLAAAREAFAEAGGAAWPDAVLHRGFDEHAGKEVALRGIPQLVGREGPAGALAARLGRREKLEPRELGEVFRACMYAWLAGELDLEDLEGFEAFRERIGAALADVTTDPEADVLVFTSAGATAGAVGAMLDLDDRRTMELSWSVLNGSVTEARFVPGHDPWLVRFNSTPHLPRDLQTWI